uniref:Large ribosomal subunit protein uL2 C-terminal domain-containing protein n=1 Tax=Paramoeba aestuarina TaxID=180227 RepID=A0A7S4KGR4_9EUKA
MVAGRDVNMKWTEFYDGYTDKFGTFKEGAPVSLRLEYIRSPNHKSAATEQFRYLWSPFEVGNDKAIYSPLFWDRQSYADRDSNGHRRGPTPGARYENLSRYRKTEVPFGGLRWSVNYKPRKNIPKWLAQIVHDKERRRHLGFFLYADGCYVVELLSYKQLPRLVYNKFFQMYIPTIGQTVELSQLTYGKEFHSLEKYPGSGAAMVRAAGASAIILRGTEPNLVPVLLPSGEVRLFDDKCQAVYGRRAGVMQRDARFGAWSTRRGISLKRPKKSGKNCSMKDHPAGAGNGTKRHLMFPVTSQLHPVRQKTKHWLSGYTLRGRLHNKHMNMAEIKQQNYGWKSRPAVYRS